MRCTVLALLMALTFNVCAYASSWTPIELVNHVYSAELDAGGPDIVVSPVTLNPYVVFDTQWNSSDANAKVVCFAKGIRTGRTFDWSATRNNAIECCPRGLKPGAASMAVGSRNGQEIIHVVYWEHMGTEDLMYVRSTDGGATWSTRVNVSNTAKVNPGSSIAADALGNVYVCWSDWTGNVNANGLDIWFRKGTFNPATQTTDWQAARKIENNGSTKSELSRLFLEPGGKLHVAWSDRIIDPRLVRYTSTSDGGATFTPIETALAAPAGDDMKPAAIAVESTTGTIYVAAHTVQFAQCCEPSAIRIATKSPGGSWTAPQLLIGNPSTNPWLAADSAGHIFMSYLRLPNSGDGDIFCLAHNSLGWSCPGNATHDASWKGYDGGHMAVDTVNHFLHVATDDSGSGPHRIAVATLDLLEPPLPVTNLASTFGNTRVTLSWRGPDEPDTGAVRIVYRTDHYPTSPTDGVIGAERAVGCPSVTDAYLQTGLANYVTYYFAVYVRDDYGNFSSPLLTSARPAASIYGDFDYDGDVDMTDFAHLQQCLNGNQPQYALTCADANLDRDTNSQVDATDLSLFLQCVSGADVLVTIPACLRD